MAASIDPTKLTLRLCTRIVMARWIREEEVSHPPIPSANCSFATLGAGAGRFASVAADEKWNPGFKGTDVGAFLAAEGAFAQ